MTALEIITAFLQSINPRARKALYLVWALAVVLIGVAAVVDFNTGKAADVLTYIGVVLGVTAAANVVPDGKIE